MDISIELYIIIFPVSLRIFHENIILRRELSYDCNLIYKSWGKLLTLENEGHLIPWVLFVYRVYSLVLLVISINVGGI